MEIKNKIYFENLDALRFLAFFLVFLSHLFFSNNENITISLVALHKNLSPYAYVGVCFFFTLSSFLITWVILSEYSLNNNFNLKNFYIRRALRILPLYFFIVVIAFGLVPFVNNIFHIHSPHLPSVWWFLTFTINYYLEYVNKDILFFLTFLWSIAVEEQFYLVWGIVMRFLYKNISTIAVILFLVYLIFTRLQAINVIHSVYFNPINYFPNFALGALLAHIGYNRNKAFNFLKNVPHYFWQLIYMAFIAFLFFQKPQTTLLVYALRHIGFTVFFCLVLFDQCFNESPLFKVGKYKWLNYLGRISFGLYCWHGVVITILKKASEIFHYQETYLDVLLLFPLITLILTIIISIISYELFEVKILKLKTYFSAAISSEN